MGGVLWLRVRNEKGSNSFFGDRRSGGIDITNPPDDIGVMVGLWGVLSLLSIRLFALLCKVLETKL